MESDSLIGTVISDYTITKYISSGSFGDVFIGTNNTTYEKVALKIPKEKNGSKLLLKEIKIYNDLNKNKSDKSRIANVKMINNEDNMPILVMDLFGPSLQSILVKHKTFRLKSIILLTIQCIEIIQDIHERGYIHRDIKPDNFVIDNMNGNNIYCIDFGLAKKYMINNKHYKFSKCDNFCGTARYASIAAHKGYTQSCKDDLESVIYMLIYLYKSKLPWMNIKHKNKKERYRLILQKKEETTEEKLCSSLPREYIVFLKYIKNMDFDEKPPYKSFINMFEKLYKSRNYLKPPKFEWSSK